MEKKSLWAPRLWVGWWWEPISSYSSKFEGIKNEATNGLSVLRSNSPLLSAWGCVTGSVEAPQLVVEVSREFGGKEVGAAHRQLLFKVPDVVFKDGVILVRRKTYFSARRRVFS